MKKLILLSLFIPGLTYAQISSFPQSLNSMFVVSQIIDISIYVLFPIFMFLLAKEKRKMSSFLIAVFFPSILSYFIALPFLFGAFENGSPLRYMMVSSFVRLKIAAMFTFAFLWKIKFLKDFTWFHKKDYFKN